MRTGRPARRVGAAAVALVVSSCGSGGGTTRVTARLIARGADEMRTDTARMHGSITRDFGTERHFLMEGEFDGPGRASALRTHVVGGAGDGDTESRSIDGVQYERFGMSVGSSRWFRVDPDSVLGRLRTVMPSITDPFGLLDAFAAISRVETLGTDEVDGVDVTHCRITIDREKAIERFPELERSRPEAVPSVLDVWIDAEGRARRVIAIDHAEGTERIELTFTDFGAEVHVEAPPPDEVSESTTASPSG